MESLYRNRFQKQFYMSNDQQTIETLEGLVQYSYLFSNVGFL